MGANLICSQNSIARTHDPKPKTQNWKPQTLNLKHPTTREQTQNTKHKTDNLAVQCMQGSIFEQQCPNHKPNDMDAAKKKLAVAIMYL